ncbi:MAG: hypothetical protein WBP41_13715 [Saprospiraceae bacterium]
MTKSLIYFLFLLVLGCPREPDNFLVDTFFKDLTKTITNNSQLEEFKNLPIDSAVMIHNKFTDIFQKPVEVLLEDSLYRSKFELSCSQNNLNLTSIEDGYVLAAMFHNSLNHRPFEVGDLKKHFYPLYQRQQILKEDNNKSTALESDCFVEELTRISSWLEDSIQGVEYIDADLVLNASNPDCKDNAMYNEVYNETLYKYLEKRPNQIIELLQLGNYGDTPLKMILENIQNPVNDGIDIDLVIKSVQNLENSDIKEKILESLKIAKGKFHQ